VPPRTKDRLLTLADLNGAQLKKENKKMADTERTERQHSTHSDPKIFTAHLVKDPANPPDVFLLCGYPGDSSLENYTRLYLNAELSDYFEVPDEAILHQQAAPAQLDPLGARYFWIQRGAELIRKGAQKVDAKSRFFCGDVQRNYWSGYAPAPAPAGGDTKVCPPNQ